MLPIVSHVFSYEMLIVTHLKRLESCLSSHFCFLVISDLLVLVLSVLFLVAIITLPLRFWHLVFELLYRCVNAVFNADKSSSSFSFGHI